MDYICVYMYTYRYVSNCVKFDMSHMSLVHLEGLYRRNEEVEVENENLEKLSSSSYDIWWHEEGYI